MEKYSFSKELDKLNNILEKTNQSKTKIISVKDRLDVMSNQIYKLSRDAKKDHLGGLITTIDKGTLLEMIRSLSKNTSYSVNELATISTITNENITDLNKTVRIILNLSQTIYHDIFTNTKSVEDIYSEISNSNSDILQQDENIKQLIQKIINRALNDKKKFDNLENRILKLEKTGLVEKNSKFIIAGFIFLSLIICSLSAFIFFKL